MSRRWQCGGQESVVTLRSGQSGEIEVTIDEHVTSGTLVPRGEGQYDVTVDGRVMRMHAVSDGRGGFWVYDGARAHHVQPGEGRDRGGVLATGSGRVTAPMPGKVVQVMVKVGQRVEVGQVVAVLEAMKMEQSLESDVAGEVVKVLVQPDTQVDMSALIVEITPDDLEDGAA